MMRNLLKVDLPVDGDAATILKGRTLDGLGEKICARATKEAGLMLAGVGDQRKADDTIDRINLSFVYSDYDTAVSGIMREGELEAFPSGAELTHIAYNKDFSLEALRIHQWK